MSRRLPSVTVMIPTYQRRHSLWRVIEPLLADNGTSEIIVVVDGADDGSFEFLLGVGARDARLKPFLTENRGQAAAQQYGASLASSDIILFLDDDVIPEQRLVSGHARRHQEADDLLVVGYMPVVAHDENSTAHWVVRRYASRYARKIETWKRYPETILRTLWGGNLSLRAAHLQRVPINRGDYQLGYHLDLDFGLRCEKAGLRGAFDPSLLAHHEYSRTVEQFLRDRAVSAADRALIHRLHKDVIGPLPEAFFREDAPLVVGLALRLIRGPISIPAERALKAAAIRSGRFLYVQEVLCDLLDRLRGQRIVDEMNRIFDQGKTRSGIPLQRMFRNLVDRK